MSFFDDRIQPISETAIRSQVVGLCQAAGLNVTNWRVHGTANQMLETFIAGLFVFSQIVTVVTRGFASLDTSTDPGDPDTFDPTNESLTPGFGFLSQYGQNTYDTEREGATFATGFYTFNNAGPGSRTFSPEGLIFTWTANSPPSPSPTYTNEPDATLYTPTLTVPAGASVTIPIVAQVAGSGSSCPSASISLTTSLVGVTGTNANPVIGNDREDADVYRDRCRKAVARLSLGGPSAAYEYLAAKTIDGDVLLNDAVVPVPTGITRVQVTEASSTGIVNAYYASASGPAIADDVTAANRNITLQSFAVPDAITFTGVAATSTTIHVVGTARIKAKLGLTAALVAQGIVASLAANAKKLPIGGVDQVAGAGVVYTSDLEGYARDGFAGLYDVIVTTPGGASTAIPVGHVPVITSVAGDGLGSGDWVVTLVP